MRVTRNGLPDRYVIDGWRHLCTDEAGFAAFSALKEKYAKEPNTAATRQKLRKEMADLHKKLAYEGRLFRRDGGKIY